MIVVKQGVVSLVELSGIGDHVVVHDGTGVDTHASVEVYLGVSAAAALGRHEDDTGGTTGAVQGGGGSVFQDSHGLDVVLRNVGQAGRIRSAIYNDERIHGRLHGCETANVDVTCAGTRSTGSALDLETRDGTDQGVGYVGRGTLLEIVGPNHGGGAGEGLLGRGTESDDDGLGERFEIRFKDDVDDGLAGDRDILGRVTHSRDLKRAVGRSRDGVVAIRVGGDTIRRALNHNGSKRNTFAVRCIFHSTGHPDILGGEAHCDQHEDGAEEQFCFFHKHYI